MESSRRRSSSGSRSRSRSSSVLRNHHHHHLSWWCRVVVAMVVMIAPLHSARVHTKQEYCEAETFRASCSSNEVVVMETAKYGRMELGRCVIRDYGYVGCSADVLAHMDSRCSGRRTCEIRIPDSTLDRPNPCPGDFKTYLEASYGCVPVHSPLCRTCRNTSLIQAESPGGYIASVSSEETGCGRKSCPWLLRAQPGQRLNITLLDFALSTRHRNQGANSQLGLPAVCYTYATLWEKGMNKPSVVCGSRERASTAFVSTTNEVHIEVAEGKRGGNFGYFLLMYETIGCTELGAPANTWIKKQDQTLTVGCPSTGETWTVTCKDNTWVGNVGTCPEGPSVFDPALGSSSGEEEGPSLPVGILVTIILAIAMVIGVLILTVGLVMIKRRRQQQPRDRPLHPATPATDLYYKEGHSTVRSQGYSTMEQKKYAQYKDKHNPGGTAPGSAFRQQENDYAYNLNMELRPLPSIPNVNEMDENAPIDSAHCVGAPPSGGVPMFGPHGEGAMAYQRSPLTVHHHMSEIPTYDHTYFTAPVSADNGGVGPHYFELDPNGMPLPPPPLPEDMSPLPSPLLITGSRYPRPPPAPPLRPLLAGSTGPGHKSPEQENAENFGKEINTSCQDVTASIHHPQQTGNGQLHPFQQQQQQQETGNCSWP